MKTRPPLLFALHGSRNYADSVARHMGLGLAELEERDFEDGEHKTRALTSVEGRNVIVFHALYGDDEHSVNDKLCRLLFFCGALKDAGARHIQVVAPYLCYARKERRTQFQDPIITRYVAALLEGCHVERLTTLEVHNLAAFDNAFRIPTRHIETAELFAGHFARLQGDAQLVAVSPDAGGAKRAELFRRALELHTGRSVTSAYMEKYRSNDIVTGGMLVGDVRGRVAVIIDDLISTGGTLLRAGQACRDAGALAVHAAAAHGLFTGGPEILENPVFDELVITDTVPPFRLDPGLVARRLTILDSTAMVAAALATEYD
ncbi:ribose-phosphate diphosphokinase [Pseudomonas stutzeri]|uniref:ribose-phosphate diphosphokinase n=1 Tax=Stutzerimonas stutzeri TaxID=316 RepID=UPI00190B269C|nr:ribose-phosphate diphosphokinase [Stutzerimonas stutzeri]MBK3869275.1 ribose-phosphate diphosphokinase [Stutzerimonas stutzeri]MBK3869319.1 ribose-phosphate diphosphokinase [Stutzerimonas stutzeri]